MTEPSSTIVPGQRWVSDSEPELGLGTIVSADRRSLVVHFEASDEERRYAASSAPLHRVTFAPGDTITDLEGERLRVDAVEERNGLAFYLCGERVVTEGELSPRMAIGGPRERLLAGRFDSPALFDLRREALEQLERIRRSPVRGLVGARIELLPHQFYIASEITSRRRPRVLLADETGLGKTIEACLILHRLLLTGRARRALILVPDALVHQWLVELRRRFNLRVSIFDEERCLAVEEGEPGTNPFEGEQLVLAGWDLLVRNEHRTRAAVDAGWDVVVVDEAHHLRWHEGQGSPEYEAVERVAAAADGLLLLTATPTQLGEEGHFARLRLLDPERHGSFEAWRAEANRHQETARIGTAIVAGEEPAPEMLMRLAEMLELAPAELEKRLDDASGRAKVLADLIDRHGPGRVIFRNTRSVLSDLPERKVLMRALSASTGGAERGEDPRIDHLESLLRDSSSEKILVICHEAETTRLIKDTLDQRLRSDIALFHEELSLVQRDRNAAWFVEPDGARMLICSEIGSEGRNFQHARHLVMFELPADPDLVEQRIGRVDRIGQHGEVLIDVPFIAGSGQEVRARWHHEGVDAFARPVATAQPLLERFGERVRALAARWDGDPAASDDATELEGLIEETAATARELEERVESGRDRLLEMSSLRRDVADALLSEIHEHDDDPAIDGLFLGLLEHFQVVADELDHRTYRFDQEGLAAVSFAALSRGDVTFTFDRELALVREDFELASIDHPLLLDAIELLRDSEAGRASFAIHERPGTPFLLLEAIFVLEAVAPPRLNVDRFLPPTGLRILVDQTGADRSEGVSGLVGLSEGASAWYHENQGLLRPHVKDMLERAEQLAETRAAATREAASRELTANLSSELERLQSLARANDRVRPEEITLVEDELRELRRHLDASRLRLDALRIIWSGPADDGVPRTG